MFKLRDSLPGIFPCLIFCFLIPGFLFAQPQILPSVEIGSDLIIKAPIVKKQLPFPVEVPADSFPSFIPRKLSVEHIPLSPKGKKLRPFHLSLRGDSSYKGSLNLASHPAWYHIPLVRFEGNYAEPQEGYSLLDLGAHIQTRFSQNFTLAHNFFYQEAAANVFASELSYYGISNHYERLNLGATLFSDLRTTFLLEELQPEADSASAAGLSYGFRHSHGFNWKWIGLKNDFLWQDHSRGLSAKLHVPGSGGGKPDLALGVMTDLKRVLPAVEIHKRLELAPRFYLEISHDASLKGWIKKELTGNYPWSTLPDEIPVTLKPLDLSLRAFKIFQAQSFLQLASLSHNSGYLLSQPMLQTLPDGETTAVKFQDLVMNTTSLDLRFNLWGIKLEQSLGLNLSHLPENNWDPLPYLPLLNAKTRLSRTWGRLSCGAGIDQQYHIEDESGNELPTILDLGLDLRYDVCKDISLIASAANLLDHKYQDHGALPERGRTFSLTFRYLPLR